MSTSTGDQTGIGSTDILRQAMRWTERYSRGASSSVTGRALYIFSTKEPLFQYMNPFMNRANTKHPIAPA